MNKTEFINRLMSETGYDKEKCEKINEVIESIFIIGRNNKEKMINSFIEKVEVNQEEANNIYNKCMKIITSSIGEKLKYPFKSKD